MEKENVVYTYNGILFSHKKEKGFIDNLKYAWQMADAQGLFAESELSLLNRLIDKQVLTYKPIHQISCSSSIDILYTVVQVKLGSGRK